MAQATSFTCEDCGERIEDKECPIVVYLVAGLAPLHPMTKAGADGKVADVTNFAMPQIVRDLLARPVARMDFCPECFAEKLGLPMVDAEGSEAARKATKK
jgi:predicted RNA-binding Zn-ribbon protein involved in translation (DUF1610 family)